MDISLCLIYESRTRTVCARLIIVKFGCSVARLLGEMDDPMIVAVIVIPHARSTSCVSCLMSGFRIFMDCKDGIRSNAKKMNVAVVNILEDETRERFQFSFPLSSFVSNESHAVLDVFTLDRESGQ
jgi:hypothetical protein